MTEEKLATRGTVTLERSYRFAAAHCYRRPEWSEEENRRRFGRCALEPGHGHNYRLSLCVAGPVDPKTGFLVDLAELDRIIAKHILDRLDHRHLNAHVPEFEYGKQIPSSENLVLWIVSCVASVLPPGLQLQKVRLEEDDTLAAEWRFG